MLGLGFPTKTKTGFEFYSVDYWAEPIYYRTMTVAQVGKLYRNDGLSAQEIGNHLNKSVWQVIKFMKKHGIRRRSAAETQRLQFFRKPLSYQKIKHFTQKEKRLYEAGLLLYWAEGAKAEHGVVDFANCDSNMVTIFLATLRRIYHVNDIRLRVLLYCYANQHVDGLINYWEKILTIPKSQFSKPYVRRDFNQKKSGKMPYGLVHIRYADKKLLAQIKEDIGILSSTFCWGGGVVKHTSL